MKKNEIIELNGVEYTLELNRDSFIQIDKICDVAKSMAILNEDLYEYIDEIDDDYNPLEDVLDEDKIKEKIEKKSKTMEKLVSRSFFIWLYPHHKLPISQVKEIIKPYLDDEEKADWIGERVGELLHKCIEVRAEYNKSKNLPPQTNRK